MSDEMRWFIAFLVAAVALGGFVTLLGNAILRVWRVGSGGVTFWPPYVYVTTVLAGLVGGVFAMTFNQELPKQPSTLPATASSNDSMDFAILRPAFGVQPAALALVRTFVPHRQTWASIILVGYAVTYFVAGVAAIATWIKFGDQTPELIKNLALVSIGLFLAIARAFCQLPTT